MLNGRFSLLVVTTLEKLLLSSELGGRRGACSSCWPSRSGHVARSCAVLPRASPASSAAQVRGVHFEEADEITIEGDNSNVILDGEMFRADPAARST